MYKNQYLIISGNKNYLYMIRIGISKYILGIKIFYISIIFLILTHKKRVS